MNNQSWALVKGNAMSSIQKIGMSIYSILVMIFVIVILVTVILIATVDFQTTLSSINGSNVVIGSTGQTAITLFNTLVSNYVTLVSFVGLIILLLLIGLLFVALGGLSWVRGLFGEGQGGSEL